jgi:hypothetical protein
MADADPVLCSILSLPSYFQFAIQLYAEPSYFHFAIQLDEARNYHQFERAADSMFHSFRL